MALCDLFCTISVPFISRQEEAHWCFLTLALYSQNLNAIFFLELSRPRETDGSLLPAVRNFAFFGQSSYKRFKRFSIFLKSHRISSQKISKNFKQMLIFLQNYRNDSWSSEGRDDPDGSFPRLLCPYNSCDYALNIPIRFFIFLNQKYIIHFFISRLVQYYV